MYDSRLRSRPAGATTVLIGLLWLPLAHEAAGSPCGPVEVGVGVAGADTAETVYFCRGQAQVFEAEDTLISSITVWNTPRSFVDVIPRFLFITEVLTEFNDVPDVQRVLLAGRTLVVPDSGDGVTPIEYRFVFEPPFSLPRKGKFAFVIQADYDWAHGIMAATGDPYPHGQVWWTGPVSDCSVPGHPVSRHPSWDLAFEVEFCRDLATPAVRPTWGRLKVIYR